MPRAVGWIKPGPAPVVFWLVASLPCMEGSCDPARVKFVLQPLLQQGHQFNFFPSPIHGFWTASTLGVVEVDHRPKAVSRADLRVGAVSDWAWLSTEIFLTVIDYILIFFFNRYAVVLFLKDNVFCVSIAAACLMILKLTIINTYFVTSVIMEKNQWYRTSSEELIRRWTAIAENSSL